MSAHSGDDVAKLEQLAHWLDSKFVIPGAKFRIGYDAIIGLLPVAGDTLTALLSCYIMFKAYHHELPFLTKLRMGWNVFVDWCLGVIPLLGIFFDVAYKSNSKNCRLLLQHLEKKNLSQTL